MTISKKTSWLIGGCAIGLILGWLLFGGDHVEDEKRASFTSESSQDTLLQIWTCSMDPQVRQSEPGSCPICGMDLIPLGSNTLDDPQTLKMSSEAIAMGNIQTSEIESSLTEKNLLLQGKVQEDERRTSVVSARFPGRLERLHVDFTGQSVRKGQKLATIYSPELISAQQELLESIALKESNPILYHTAYKKLELWGISEKQIQAIESGMEVINEMTIFAPHKGVVRNKKITLGQYVIEGTPLFEITDLSKVWLIFDAFESDAPWVKTGDEIEFSLESSPGRKFKEKISFVSPVMDPKTRSIQVRVETSNLDALFKPEMLVRGKLKAKNPVEGKKLLVPKSAVLWTGPRSLVYVLREDQTEPAFQYREIVLGPDMGTHYVVSSGLMAGERVVTNGAFKVDAAAQLAGKFSMMNAPEKPPVAITVPHDFHVFLNEIIDGYLKIKDALVASLASEARDLSQNLYQKVSSGYDGSLDEVAFKEWLGLRSSIINHLEKIGRIKDLPEIRTQFGKLSNELDRLINQFGLPGRQVFQNYCPMAEKDEGAIWISNSKEIRNPYFGTQMLKCGEIRKTYGIENSINRPPQGHNH